jgi:hypothetical protein
MRHSTALARVAFLGSVVGLGCVNAEPVITITPSPSPQLAIIPVLGSGSPTAVALIAGAAPAVQKASFLIANNSGRPILSILVLTVASSPSTGVKRTSRLMLDAFQSSGLRPVLRPGHRVFVMPPLTLIPEEQIPAMLNSRIPAAKNNSDWFVGTGLAAVNVATVGIDSVIFANGEVQGPDTEDFMEEVPNRRRAAGSVLAAIKAKDLEALAKMANQRDQQNDGHFSEWQRRFASDYLGAKDEASQAFQIRRLQSLQAYPAGPRLFRSAASSN